MLCNIPERPVRSNSGYNTENISTFLEYHLKLIVQKVKGHQWFFTCPYGFLDALMYNRRFSF